MEGWQKAEKFNVKNLKLDPLNEYIKWEGRMYGETHGGDVAGPVDSGIVNSGGKTNADRPISGGDRR